MGRCGNKYDQKSRIQITDSDMEAFCEQVQDESKNIKFSLSTESKNFQYLKLHGHIPCPVLNTNASMILLRTVAIRKAFCNTGRNIKLRNITTLLSVGWLGGMNNVKNWGHFVC